MKVEKMGYDLSLHSGMSTVGTFTQHLDDSKNALEISKEKFETLLDLLTAVSIEPREIKTVLAVKGVEQQEYVERELEEIDDGDTEGRKDRYKKVKARAFRTLLRYPESHRMHSTCFNFVLYRYVVKFTEARAETHAKGKRKSGSTNNWVMRINYTLEARHATAKYPASYTIQCACNATSLEGQSGSAFAGSMNKLEPQRWTEKITELYCSPYRLLETIAGSTRRQLHTLMSLDSVVPRTKVFRIGLTPKEMLDAIRIQTFGFRWILTLGKNKTGRKSDPRELMILMLFVLYNSKHRFLHRDVGVGKDMGIEVEISRKSDAQNGMFDADSRVEPDIDSDTKDADDPLTSRLGRAFKGHKKDPVVGIRIRVIDYRRANLYTISFHIPSEKYLRRLWEYTDALYSTDAYYQSPAGKLRLKNMWKEVARYGVVIGVDAYSGYLRNRRRINTLTDLLRAFNDNYNRDIQKFCQDILESAYRDVDVHYWMGVSWMELLSDHKTLIEEDDKPLWKWFLNNPESTIVDFMLKKKMFKGIDSVNGVPKPTKDHLKLVKLQVDYWKETYGYDPSYSFGAHSEVVRAWYSVDNPRRFYEAERQGLSLSEKVGQTKLLLTDGLGRLLPQIIAAPLNAASRLDKPARH